MPSGSRVCPYCGKLNSADNGRCFNCQRRLPGPVATAVLGTIREFSADGLPATKLIAFVCIITYALMMATDGPMRLELSMVGGFRLSSLLRFGALYADLAYGEPWRLISAMFLHLGLFHIGMNMLGLAGLGMQVEQRLGSARFVLVYTVSGVAGFVISQWWYGFSPPTAGASGALFGLVGARIGQLWATRDPSWKREGVNYALGALIWNFVMPMNSAAHFGGLFVGAAVSGLFERERRPWLRQRVLQVLAAICLLSSVGSLVLSIRSPVWKAARASEDARAQEAERRRLDSE
jgi:rhomboid protease GluP